MNNSKKSKSNRQKALATTMALALLATGTLAWQSFDQVALNESSGLPGDPGGRLHDDFDGTNKDIYIENYADPEEGTDVYARVRLSQYMEYGTNPGILDGEDLTDPDYVEPEPETGEGEPEPTSITMTVSSDDLIIVRGDKPVAGVTTPDINDKSSWDIFLYQGGDSNSDTIRYYQQLNFGSRTKANIGRTVYMPTFNKNTESLDPDINGRLEGTNGSRFWGEQYNDYIKYSVGAVITDDAEYSPNAEIVMGLDSNYIEEKHTAKYTLSGSVISMSDWHDLGKPIGNYWVYDVDGWAYWADAIRPQTATSLLLDSITTLREPEEDWYYGIHVISQMATKGDWGSEDEETGMFADGGITEDGLDLLNRVSLITVDPEPEIEPEITPEENTEENTEE